MELQEARAGLLRQVTGRAERLEEAENQAVRHDIEVAGPAPTTDGLRDRPQNTFPYREGGIRCAAAKEYRRTIEEFRRTGAVEEKGWDDFAHMINPPNVRGAVWLAHSEACDEIERWRGEQGIAPAEADPSQSLTVDEDGSHETELDGSVGDEGEGNERDTANNETAAAQEAADQTKLRALLEGELRARAARGAPDDEISAPLPAPIESGRKPAAILRGVEFEADAPGRWTRHEPLVPRLNIAPPPASLPAANDQTEALLNDIIGECHFLMREVAFRSMCQAQVAEDRVNWVGSAIRLAETGAKVAKSVARLRHGPKVQESHHKVTVENKVAVVAQGGGGPVP